MIAKQNKAFSIPEDKIPEILQVRGAENDPNLQDVKSRDLPNYLREQYWIEQFGPTNRWKTSFSAGCHSKLRLADLGRKLDDPGDAFYFIGIGSTRFFIQMRTWFEVTEVYAYDNGEKVKKFIREYNGLRGKGVINAEEFLRSLDFGIPNPSKQRDMADRVISVIENKIEKGSETGSYKSLVSEYGTGVLIVGLPLWFATFPAHPKDSSMVLKDFYTRLALLGNRIEYYLLHTKWCPFDSIVVMWNPTWESIDEWAKFADKDFYKNPSNQCWNGSFPIISSYCWGEWDFPKPYTFRFYLRWDRYSSLDKMIDSQLKQLSSYDENLPFGVKSCWKVELTEDILSNEKWNE